MELGGKDGETLKEVVEEQKKKISTLKKAFLQKQEDAKKLQQTQREQELRIFVLEKSLEEHKDRQRSLEHEVVEKAEEISHLQSLLKGLASTTAEQQMKKLLEEYSALKIAYTRLEESTRTTRQELHHSKKRESEQTADSEEVVQQLRTEVAELTKKLETLHTDNLMTRKTNVQLSDKNSKLEEESERLRQQLRELRSELELRDFTLKGKQDIILSLNESLLRHGDTEAALSEELMRVKNELIEARSFYQKYDVMLIGTLTNSPAKLILKLDPSGELMLEVESNKGTKRSYSSRTVEAIYIHPTRPMRLVISLIGEKRLEVESAEAEKIAANLKDAIFRRSSSE